MVMEHKKSSQRKQMLELNNLIADNGYYKIISVDETTAVGEKFLAADFTTPGRKTKKTFARDTKPLSGTELKKIVADVKSSLYTLANHVIVYDADPFARDEEPVEKSTEEVVENVENSVEELADAVPATDIDSTTAESMLSTNRIRSTITTQNAENIFGSVVSATGSDLEASIDYANSLLTSTNV